MTVREAIRLIAEGGTLSEEQASAVAREIMAGQSTAAQVGGLLVGLRVRGETVDEITGFAKAMRDAAVRVPVRSGNLVDTCGTGGDGKGTFNISTVTAFVAAGAGCRVAKHGNRWISGKCGSADVLEALGVRVEISPEVAARCVDEIGIGFLFAPLYHAGTKHAATARREIGIRSLFNMLGPLANPAGAKRQLIGVFDAGLTRPMTEVLKRLGTERALVVYGADGLDEFTIAAESRVSELREGAIREYAVRPEQAGVSPAAIEELRGGDAARNAEIARAVLSGASGAERSVVLLNAGAVIYVSGRAESLQEGVELAKRSIDSGAARVKLEQLVAMTQGAA